MSERRTAFVIVTPSLPKWISDFNIVSSALAASGFATEIFYPKANGRADAGWDSERVIRAAEGRLHPDIARSTMPVARNAGPLRLGQLLLTTWLALRLALRRDSVFVLWSAFPTVVFGPWLRLLGRPCLYLITGLGIQFSERWRGSWRQRASRSLYRFLFSSGNARVIVHNAEDKQFLVEATGIAAERVFVTGGCGVDPAEYPYRATARVNDTPVILVPSRILRDKGILDASRASQLLSERGIAHQMLFTSNPVTGRADALTEAELAEAASPPGVVFTGYRDDLKSLYAAADVVCIPSWYREGLQTALLEAAAAGCPLVACDNVGARDFLRPGIDALVVPPRDPRALADALAEALGDPQAAERRRVAAHARLLSGFTQRHMLHITLDVLRGLGLTIAPTHADGATVADHGN